MLLKNNVNKYSLNLSNFVYINAFDVETALENVILERLELQIIFTSSQPVGTDKEILLRKILMYFTKKLKCNLWL